MMTIARSPMHHFYSVFRVSDSTFDELRQRLDEIGLLWKHLYIDEYREEVLIFGSTGFKREQSNF